MPQCRTLPSRETPSMATQPSRAPACVPPLHSSFILPPSPFLSMQHTDIGWRALKRRTAAATISQQRAYGTTSRRKSPATPASMRCVPLAKHRPPPSFGTAEIGKTENLSAKSTDSTPPRSPRSKLRAPRSMLQPPCSAPLRHAARRLPAAVDRGNPDVYDVWFATARQYPVCARSIRSRGIEWLFPRENTAMPAPVHGGRTMPRNPGSCTSAPSAAPLSPPMLSAPIAATTWAARSSRPSPNGRGRPP